MEGHTWPLPATKRPQDAHVSFSVGVMTILARKADLE